jgi:hypothetical protein
MNIYENFLHVLNNQEYNNNSCGKPYYDKGQTNTRCGNYNKPPDRVNVAAESAEACFDSCLKNSKNCDYFSYNPKPGPQLGNTWQCLYNTGTTGCGPGIEKGDQAVGYTTYKVEPNGPNLSNFFNNFIVPTINQIVRESPNFPISGSSGITGTLNDIKIDYGTPTNNEGDGFKGCYELGGAKGARAYICVSGVEGLANDFNLIGVQNFSNTYSEDCTSLTIKTDIGSSINSIDINTVWSLPSGSGGWCTFDSVLSANILCIIKGIEITLTCCGNYWQISSATVSDVTTTIASMTQKQKDGNCSCKWPDSCSNTKCSVYLPLGPCLDLYWLETQASIDIVMAGWGDKINKAIHKALFPAIKKGLTNLQGKILSVPCNNPEKDCKPQIPCTLECSQYNNLNDCEANSLNIPGDCFWEDKKKTCLNMDCKESNCHCYGGKNEGQGCSYYSNCPDSICQQDNSIGRQGCHPNWGTPCNQTIIPIPSKTPCGLIWNSLLNILKAAWNIGIRDMPISSPDLDPTKTNTLDRLYFDPDTTPITGMAQPIKGSDFKFVYCLAPETLFGVGSLTFSDKFAYDCDTSTKGTIWLRQIRLVADQNRYTTDPIKCVLNIGLDTNPNVSVLEPKFDNKCSSCKYTKTQQNQPPLNTEPSCNQCNGNGCDCFRCSAATTWHCPTDYDKQGSKSCCFTCPGKPKDCSYTGPTCTKDIDGVIMTGTQCCNDSAFVMSDQITIQVKDDIDVSCDLKIEFNCNDKNQIVLSNVTICNIHINTLNFDLVCKPNMKLGQQFCQAVDALLPAIQSSITGVFNNNIYSVIQPLINNALIKAFKTPVNLKLPCLSEDNS